MIVLDFLIGSHNGHYEAFDCTGCQDKSNTTELLRAIHAVKGVAPRIAPLPAAHLPCLRPAARTGRSPGADRRAGTDTCRRRLHSPADGTEQHVQLHSRARPSRGISSLRPRRPAPRDERRRRGGALRVGRHRVPPPPSHGRPAGGARLQRRAGAGDAA